MYWEPEATFGKEAWYVENLNTTCTSPRVRHQPLEEQHVNICILCLCIILCDTSKAQKICFFVLKQSLILSSVWVIVTRRDSHQDSNKVYCDSWLQLDGYHKHTKYSLIFHDTSTSLHVHVWYVRKSITQSKLSIVGSMRELSINDDCLSVINLNHYCKLVYATLLSVIWEWVPRLLNWVNRKEWHKIVVHILKTQM